MAEFKRYGYRIKKSEPDPYARVEYIHDAVGMSPARMIFSAGTFDYGDWGDKWFVTGNKPLMLKRDGAVGYYLDPNDYTKKSDGTASDIANASYDGNAMAQFPLCWFYRYEDDDYEYEIVSDGKYDENYEAFAHTRADGSIAPFFYWSMFGGSEIDGKIRSLSGKTLSRDLTAQQQIDKCTANGDNWYTHTWSQRECIRTLLVLMGKSTNTTSVFGYGNCRGIQDSNALLQTGTLNDKGQFFGYSSNNQQIKVFHVETFWGDQWDRIAGVISNNGVIYVKMTPEGDGYRVTDVNGYTNVGVTVSGVNEGRITQVKCSKFGIIPKVFSGIGNGSYYCNGGGFESKFTYLLHGAAVHNPSGYGGAFAFFVGNSPSDAYYGDGCGLSVIKPKLASCLIIDSTGAVYGTGT